MPVIPQVTIEQIRNASDIVDVIGSFVPLKRAGTNFLGLCPFHKEKTPSFNVNPSKQIFHCFGCHKGGDVFTFIREFENLSFLESVQRLADRARISIDFEMTPGQREEGSLKEKLRTLHDQVAKLWEITLASDASARVARDYLARRGVSDEAVKRFRMGYAPDKCPPRQDQQAGYRRARSIARPRKPRARGAHRPGANHTGKDGIR